MGSEHHGSRADDKYFRERFMEQMEKDSERTWPNGRISGEDDGELAFMVSFDPVHKTIRIDFPMKVDWLRMSPERARGLAAILLEEAQKIDNIVKTEIDKL